MELGKFYTLPRICAIIICTSICTSLAFADNGNLFVFLNRSDIFMDLYNTLQASRVDTAFTIGGNSYPPILLLCLRLIFFPFASYSDSFQFRDSNPFISFLLIILLLSLIGALVGTADLGRRAFRPKVSLFLLILFFPPVFIQFDRLNTLIIAFAVLSFCIVMATCSRSQSFETGSIIRRYLSELSVCYTFTPSQWLLLGFIICSFIKQYFIISAALYILLCPRRLSRRIFALLLYLASYTLINQLPFWGGYYQGSVLELALNTRGFDNFTQTSQVYNIYSLDVLDLFPNYFLTSSNFSFGLQMQSFWLFLISIILLIFLTYVCLVFCFCSLLFPLLRGCQRHSFAGPTIAKVDSLDGVGMRAQLSLLPCLLLPFLSNSVAIGPLLFVVPYAMLYFFSSNTWPFVAEPRRMLLVYTIIILLSAMPFSLYHASHGVFIFIVLSASRYTLALLFAVLIFMFTLPSNREAYLSLK